MEQRAKFSEHDFSTEKKQATGSAADSDMTESNYEDFYAYLPKHQYMHIASRTLWPPASVNARLPDRGNMKPSRWLDINRAVEQITWAPGEPLIIRDWLVAEGGFIDHPNARVFNLYRPPPPRTLLRPDITAEPWLAHVRKLYGENSHRIIKWCAYRVQRPQIKINHALVFGGDPGIGKDTLLAPVIYAAGRWNCQEILPGAVTRDTNGYLKSVILRISEGRDLGRFDRYAFYDTLKTAIAAPPDVLRINEKYVGEYYIPNLCGVVITTNNKNNGIYLPADDRRHYVSWSDCKTKDFDKDYFSRFWHYLEHGGNDAVAVYLASADLSDLDPKAPPSKTEAFWEIVNSNRTTEDAEIADVIDALNSPNVRDAITIMNVMAMAQALENNEIAEWLKDRRNSRSIPYRLENCDYVAVRNHDASDGLWRIDGKRQAIYARRELSERDKQEAAKKLARGKG